MARVVLEHLTKVFPLPGGQAIRAVDDLSLTVEDKEFVVLLGPSGSGKTTILRLIAGLEEATQGTVAIEDKIVNDLPPGKRDLAMVFQNHALYPHMSVYENMAFGLKVRRCPRAEIQKRVHETAELLGLAECLLRKPAELSGGQRQRVAVGRAIVRRPRAFLFDEPLSNLDPQMRVQMRSEISRLHRQLTSTMIYVTHDQIEAMTLGDRIAVLKNGVIQQMADPMALYQRPVNMFVAAFIGSPSMNFFNGTILNGKNGLLFQEQTLQSAAGPSLFSIRLELKAKSDLAGYVGKKIVFGIRPENICDPRSVRDGAADQIVEAIIEGVQPIGPETYLHITSGAHSFVARVPATCQAKPGEKVSLLFDMTSAHFFDPLTERTIL